jgi:hypothetical protein
VQRYQPHDRSADEIIYRLRFSLACRHALAIGQVTHHLVRSHPAPLARRTGGQALDALADGEFGG